MGANGMKRHWETSEEQHDPGRPEHANGSAAADVIMDEDDALRAEHRRAQREALAVAQGDGLAGELAAEFALHPEAARELLDYVLERVAPEAPAIERVRLQEAERRIDGYFNGVFHLLRSQMQRQKSVADLLRTFDVMCLALEFVDVAGTAVPSELARRYGKSKETVNKPLLEFQKRLRLMKRAGQRPDAARETMAARRVERIKMKKAE